MVCKHRHTKWVCRRHGKYCESYVVGIVEDANNGKILKSDLKLIKLICSNCGVSLNNGDKKK